MRLILCLTVLSLNAVKAIDLTVDADHLVPWSKTFFTWYKPAYVSDVYTVHQPGVYVPVVASWMHSSGSLPLQNTGNHRLTEHKTQKRSASLETAFAWSQVDFDYPTSEARKLALSSGAFIPANNLPLGVAVDGSRVFITLPRWKKGIPATLATVQYRQGNKLKNPPLTPYPSWSWHGVSNCLGLISVFRLAIDKCRRLWVLDSGSVEIATGAKALCPAKLLVFDLDTDQLIWRHVLPKSNVLPGSLLVNIEVEVGEDCHKSFAYMSDVFRYSLHTYSLEQDKSWRINHPFFLPEPLNSFYNMDGFKFQWVDGIFGLAVSEKPGQSKKTLYFHPLSSHREFSVSTNILHNETIARASAEEFKVLGEPRRGRRGQATASAITREGVLFYNLLTRNAVGCWNSATLHTPPNHFIVAQSNETLSFPNDLRLDLSENQSVWILSNKLHIYLYSNLDPNQINFRVMTAKVKDLIKGTVCDPNVALGLVSEQYRRSSSKSSKRQTTTSSIRDDSCND